MCIRDSDYIVKNETSFMRTENALERLFKHRHVVTSLAKYKALNKILIWGLVIIVATAAVLYLCLLYTSPSPRDRTRSRMPSSA